MSGNTHKSHHHSVCKSLVIGLLTIFIAQLSYHQAVAKPGADVAIVSPSEYQSDEYSDLDIVLLIKAPAIAGNMQLTLKPDQQLKVHNFQGTYDFPLNGKDETYKIPLSLSTTESGRYYILLNVQIAPTEGRRNGRAMGIAIQVGDPIRQKDRQNKSAAQERRIKAMPAKESVGQTKSD